MISRFRISGIGQDSIDDLVAKGCKDIVIDVYGNVHASLEHPVETRPGEVLGLPSHTTLKVYHEHP